MTEFKRVKQILDNAIAAWKQQNGGDPALSIHGGTFAWQTKQEIAEAKAFGKRLIDPAKVGNGQGATTNLVIALKTGVAPFERMPAGGPFVPDSEIQEIVQRIDAGMPDGAAALTAKVAVRKVASGLSRPVFATAPAGDRRLFLVEQHTGLVKILNLGTATINATPFLQVTGLATGNEQGLLGLAFHPQYSSNGLFFVNMTKSVSPNNIVTVISRFNVSATNPDVADANSAKTVLSIPQPGFPNHKCGWLAFGPKDHLLYIGTGDGGSANDPGNRAQNLAELLGKMLRIDVDGDEFPGDASRNYKIPPGNPFVHRAGARPEIWAFGLRNPWRNSFDRQTGDFYIADVGQDHTEEINFQPAASTGGENYGWRAKEGTHNNPTLGTPDPIPPGVTDPIHEYSHDDGLAVVGGYVYRGEKIASLQGTYFFADFEGRIWTFRYDGTAKRDFTERTAELLPGGVTAGISSFGEDAAGELYFTDLGGDVCQIVQRA